jgi:hypothetical protein
MVGCGLQTVMPSEVLIGFSGVAHVLACFLLEQPVLPGMLQLVAKAGGSSCKHAISPSL